MKPEQFIKRYGVDESRQVIAKSPEGTTHIHSVTWQNYKQGDSNNYVWGRSGQEGWYLSIYETLNGMMVLEDLKRLVESLDIIEFHGGISGAKLVYKLRPSEEEGVDLWVRLEHAIKDHESIYGGGDD